MKRLFFTAVLGLFLNSNAFAQSGIAVWGEEFRDRSGIAIMVHMKTEDANICFKDVEIKTNFGEDSMPDGDYSRLKTRQIEGGLSAMNLICQTRMLQTPYPVSAKAKVIFAKFNLSPSIT